MLMFVIVSSLTWLENHLWLSIHTSNNQSPPTSIYHIITRQPPSSFTFQKVTDPVEPFGSEKIPHHSVLRLRDFPPAIQDLLIISSTATAEMGVLSRSQTPLATDKPADSITGVFTTTEFLDDTKRPTLPMTDSMDDSTPIGVALDLSSKDKVYKPIPSDVELEESPGPLPGFWVLTNEGILCSWWVVYNDSIKQGTSYPGLTIAEGSASAPTVATAAPAAPASAFANPTPSAFGSGASAAPAFGSSAQLGQKSSPWGSAGSAAPSTTGGAAFGSRSFGSPAAPSAAPAFGQPSSLGFGQASQIGAKASPWATSTSSAAPAGAAPAFGQTGFASFANNNKSAFGSATSNATPSAPATGGFAGFSGSSGFASLGNDKSGSSVFGSGAKPPAGPFASSSNADTAFPPKQDQTSGSVFGSTPFKLQSSFKPDASAQDQNEKPTGQAASSLFGNAFGSALTDAANKPPVTTPAAKDEDMDTMGAVGETPQSKPQSSLLAPAFASPESTTPTSTPAPSKFGFPTSSATSSSIFGQPSKPPPPNPFAPSSGGGLFSPQQSTPKPSSSLFGSAQATPKASGGIFGNQTEKPRTLGSLFGSKPAEKEEEPKIKTEEDVTLPPITATPAKPAFTSTPQTARQTRNDSSDFVNVSKPLEKTKAGEGAPLPPDFTKPAKPTTSRPPDDAPLPPDFAPAASVKKPTPLFPAITGPPSDDSDLDSDEEDDEESDEEEDNEEEDNEGSEGSGVDVAKDLSPSITGLTPTPGFTPQSSFGGIGGTTPHDPPRPLFGEVSRNAPLFPRPTETSPRSPSPVRGAIPNRVMRNDSMRSVSAPGMASQLLGPKKSQSQTSASITSKDQGKLPEDPFLTQHRKLKARQEAEETQPLVDEEDDEVQKILASEVEGTLVLDEFIAHSNVAPPAKESIPSQVEAVYRDINSMIDTLGLNARTIKAFNIGHTENCKQGGRHKDDLEDPDDWVLCEVEELGEVLANDLYPDLEDGRVRDLDDKLDAVQELARDMHRLRAKQEDLKKILMVRIDPDQVEATQSLPLSAEQSTQQNELRRELANFSKLLAEAEEALTLLKTRIVSVSSASGRGGSNVPTVDAVIRTISKMTTMVEKRSGDIDVLENQLRKVRLNSGSREGSPMTPQARRSVMFSPDTTPSRTFRQSFGNSVMSLSASVRATPPRKKLSGFSQEEKGELMDKRTRRQTVLAKLKANVEKKGVNVWNMEDIE